MMMLSEQLSALSERSKKTEEVVAAAREKNREKLVTERARLKSSIADGNAKAQKRAAGAKGKAEARWSDMRTSMEQRFTSINDAADETAPSRSQPMRWRSPCTFLIKLSTPSSMRRGLEPTPTIWPRRHNLLGLPIAVAARRV
jgi:hypothetical protein